MVHIPYKGSVPALTDVIGGQVAYAVETVAATGGFIKSGKLKTFGVTSARRSAALPDVPTLAESADLPGYDCAAWVGYAAPAGTPRDILVKLAAEIQKAVQASDLKDRYVAARHGHGVEHARRNGRLHAPRAGPLRADHQERRHQDRAVMALEPRIAALAAEMTAWRRDIHAHPELGFEEPRTSDLVAAQLRAFGVEVHRGIGRTGVVGVLRAGSSKRSRRPARRHGLRCRSRRQTRFAHRSKHAGRMHACGHDGHTTMLLGAANYLAADAAISTAR